jgi:hypothetical protein
LRIKSDPVRSASTAEPLDFKLGALAAHPKGISAADLKFLSVRRTFV